MNIKAIAILAVTTVCATGVCSSTAVAVIHPIDPLTARKFSITVSTLGAGQYADENSRYCLQALNEPQWPAFELKPVDFFERDSGLALPIQP
ncbi:MAG: hypothetical protein EXS42_08540 [Lacunisphaera sp.]|nr:hypothetical protein [Lacunisphaera sp.]